MILLIGGTSETAPLATALARAGYRVLVSTATDIPLQVGSHVGIERRFGPLDEEAMKALVLDREVKGMVDAAHPYAEAAHTTAGNVARKLGMPYFRWLRHEAIEPDHGIVFAKDHEEAATIACSSGRPVLLTTGSRNLRPYVHEADRTGVPLFARILSSPASIEAAKEAGIRGDRIMTGRGPFSREQNVALIEQFNIGVMVTKDSGEAGGVPAKLEAAKTTHCELVVVRRPETLPSTTFDDVDLLVKALMSTIRP